MPHALDPRIVRIVQRCVREQVQSGLQPCYFQRMSRFNYVDTVSISNQQVAPGKYVPLQFVHGRIRHACGFAYRLRGLTEFVRETASERNLPSCQRFASAADSQQ